MAILDVDSLLLPVSDDEPCGSNLEYDATFAEFETAARGKAEQQYGETIIPGEEPNWREVRRLGSELILRTKDLRVGCLLARGLLESDGFPGFADGLALVRGYLERYWETVHPQLDPDDDNDPTLRVNTVYSLSDHLTTVQSLRTVPMVSARAAGRFSLRDLNIAHGDVAAPAGDEAPTVTAVEAAFAECALEDLRNDATAVRQSIDHAETIEALVTSYVGAARAVSLEDLRSTLQELNVILAGHLEHREEIEREALAVGQSVSTTGGVGAAASLSGSVSSREDVVRALDKICEYYARHEPSSPLPLLLGRARRLANKSFVDIVKDLTPDAVAQIQALGGVDRDESGD